MFIKQEVFGNENITNLLPIYNLFIILLVVISVAALTKKVHFNSRKRIEKTP